MFANLNSLWNILAYSGGFAFGTMVGMWLEGKIALGTVAAYIISTDKGDAIARAVRTAGFGATELSAHGKSSPVSLVSKELITYSLEPKPAVILRSVKEDRLWNPSLLKSLK